MARIMRAPLGNAASPSLSTRPEAAHSARSIIRVQADHQKSAATVDYGAPNRCPRSDARGRSKHSTEYLSCGASSSRRDGLEARPSARSSAEVGEGRGSEVLGGGRARGRAKGTRPRLPRQAVSEGGLE